MKKILKVQKILFMLALVLVAITSTVNAKSNNEMKKSKTVVSMNTLNGITYNSIYPMDNLLTTESQLNNTINEKKETLETKKSQGVAKSEEIDKKEAEELNKLDGKFIADVRENSCLNIRKKDSIKSDVIGKIYYGGGGIVLEESDEWIKIKSGNIEGYVKSEYCATGKRALNIAKVACKYKDGEYVIKEGCEYKAPAVNTSTNLKMLYTPRKFSYIGVIHWGGWDWTYYSQKVLPGGGLRIPGRHVDDNGYVCDENNYICLASSTLSKGTVINTPLGKKGKIYDSGCASNVIDVYVNW